MDDISAVLRATLEDMADVPDALKEVAFSKVFDLRAGNAGPVPSLAQTPAPQPPLQHTGGSDSSDALAAIAAKAATSREVVAEVFEVDGDAVRLIVPTGKLPSQTASATKEIALVIAGARQAAGLEDWTSWDVIRDVCQEFKRLDSGNFAKTIRSMEDEFNQRKESERKMLVKLSRPGWEAFGAVVKRLGGDTA